MKGKRRNHSGQFKAKVVLAATKGDKTAAELSKEFQVHPTQITQWKKELTDALPEIFSLQKHQSLQEQQALIDFEYMPQQYKYELAL